MKNYRERKTDKLYRQYLRERQNYTCQHPNCRRIYPVDGDLNNLTVSHFWGRGHEGTRFDDENCDLLCWYPCHQNWQSEGRKEYEAFMVQKLGVEGYNRLMIRAKTPKPRDDKMDEFIIKKKLEQLAVVSHNL